MTKTSSLALIAVSALLASSSTVSAQAVHMNSKTKVEVFKLLTKAAAQKVEAGAPKQAKLICIASFDVVRSQFKIPRWLERNKAMLGEYDKTCSPLWKDHKADPAGGDAVVARYAQKITDYGEALAFKPFGNYDVAAGFETHKRTINALKIFDEALETAVELIDKLPEAQTLLAKPPRGFEKLYPHLLSIITGKIGATELEEKEAVPAVLTALADIDKSVKASDKPGPLTSKATEMTKWLELLRTARPKHEKVDVYTKRIAAIEAEAERKWKAYVKSTRMPKSKWKGKSGVVAELKAAYTKRYPKESVERIVIASDSWGPARGEGWWKGDVWTWSVFSRLPNVSVAVKQKIKGKTSYRMFNATFARERKGSGWTKPYLLRTNTGRPILKENIKK